MLSSRQRLTMFGRSKFHKTSDEFGLKADENRTEILKNELKYNYFISVEKVIKLGEEKSNNILIQSFPNSNIFETPKNILKY